MKATRPPVILDKGSMSKQSSSSETNNNNRHTSLIDRLQISPAFQCRVNQRNSCVCSTCDSSIAKSDSTSSSSSTSSLSSFVLYLPTVNLRMDQNPAFALACHIANYYHLPLIVLAVALDDHSMPKSKTTENQKLKEVTMTSRRLAFIIEALSDSCKQWADHGAGVAIRVHKTNGRCPDHLTLASRASAVVVDEPFVHPFLSFVHKIEKVCSRSKTCIPCYRVDGSTTVPPCSVLKRINNRTIKNDSSNVDIDNMMYYTGVPKKAWIWQKQTESLRKNQIESAMKGDFDAPKLLVKIDDDQFFFCQKNNDKQVEVQLQKAEQDEEQEVKIKINNDNQNTTSNKNKTNHHDQSDTKISHAVFPLQWQDETNNAPDMRPWTVSELVNLYEKSSTSIKEWSMTWPGADSSVKPCYQTVGTTKAGMNRWNCWVRERKGLIYYARRRTDPVQPHASSRMSCYLNFGIVSIFRLVHEVKHAQSSKVAGADKFEEEIIKWREMSYAHAFSRGDYNGIQSVPIWAQQYLLRQSNKQSSINNHQTYDLYSLESGDTGDVIWDAMQKYLSSTGELHNNVRMTWGKQLVHWNHHSLGGGNPTTDVLNILCYLNDRYALDGLSPPSYAGLLWCLGWCDKPNTTNSGISKKRRYKLSASAFKDAAEKLMNDDMRHSTVGHQSNILQALISSGRKAKRSTTQTNHDMPSKKVGNGE
mmetsp:Transcript_14862/g.16957  ORF Transcript_14862/g.16957 Transcript_14862/m.16957 type:complete len:702 (-) Transcript_14862:114-2219(-)